ncbi:MAG: (5-formylfuran-3-yl)methyl phosphate synthase [Planctomycetes bacterium]|nr:(5-formylfuran-3-yl)methyl phosphate synthase [Planctomycetota bacterium]
MSVRSAAEARAAVAGGCDILDVKEPRRGSLGMADTATIADVLAVARERQPAWPVTAALGETTEWLTGSDPFAAHPSANPRQRPSTKGSDPLGEEVAQGSVDVAAVLPGLACVKLGTAGLGTSRDWTASWRRIRDRIETAAGQRLRWIAVAYADWQNIEAPSPEAVISAAIETGCVGVLFDTFDKGGGTLFQRLEPKQLATWIVALRREFLLTALAGGLTADDIAIACEVAPDVIAVRSAACTGGRTGKVSPHAVARLRTAIERRSSKSLQPGLSGD